MEFASSILLLNPGVYILRHPKTGTVPLTVSRAPGSQRNNGKLEVIGTPGTERTVLRSGADCIVMHVYEAPVELVVTAYLDKAGTAVPALRVDQVPLDGGPAPAPRTAVAPAPAAQGEKKAIAIPANGVSVIAHIERKGDVVASNGILLGDPDTNLRVEGFQVMWPDRPQGADLAYNIAVEGIGQLPVVKSGKFCGTRGQARRITEATFSLVGPQANEFKLEGTAYFTGGFQVPVESGHALGGPSGLEHLTALRLNVVKAGAAKAAPAANPWDESSRTKVFKSKTGSANAVHAAAPTPPVKKTGSVKASPVKAAAVKEAPRKAAPKAAAKATKATKTAASKTPAKSSTKAVKAVRKK